MREKAKEVREEWDRWDLRGCHKIIWPGAPVLSEMGSNAEIPSED